MLLFLQEVWEFSRCKSCGHRRTYAERENWACLFTQQSNKLKWSNSGQEIPCSQSTQFMVQRFVRLALNQSLLGSVTSVSRGGWGEMFKLDKVALQFLQWVHVEAVCGTCVDEPWPRWSARLRPARRRARRNWWWRPVSTHRTSPPQIYKCCMTGSWGTACTMHTARKHPDLCSKTLRCRSHFSARSHHRNWSRPL